MSKRELKFWKLSMPIHLGSALWITAEPNGGKAGGYVIQEGEIFIAGPEPHSAAFTYQIEDPSVREHVDDSQWFEIADNSFLRYADSYVRSRLAVPDESVWEHVAEPGSAIKDMADALNYPCEDQERRHAGFRASKKLLHLLGYNKYPNDSPEYLYLWYQTNFSSKVTPRNY